MLCNIDYIYIHYTKTRALCQGEHRQKKENDVDKGQVRLYN